MFRSINATNFFSWKSLEFNFNSGVTLITGDNLDDNTSEGAGKSSIVNALCWALYGQLPKDTNVDDVIKTGEKSCCVVITLSDGTEIIRSRKPNELSIQHNENIIQGKDAKETQKLINDLVGMSFDTFCQSVYFAQNYSNKFITATQENKAKILSELQDLSVFDKASKASADKARDIKTSVLVQLDTQKMYTQNNLLQLKSEITTFEQLSNNFDRDRLSQLDEVIANSYTVNVQIKELESNIKSISDLGNLDDKTHELSEVNRQLMECQSRLYYINMLRSQKQQALLDKNCPTCNQELPGVGCEEIVIPDDTSLKSKQITLLEQKFNLDTEYKGLLDKKHQSALFHQKLENLSQQKSSIALDIERLETLENPYLGKLEILAINKKNLYNKLEVINENILLQNKLQTRYEYLKDGFKQIKSYVFQSLLGELNRNTNKYLTELFEVPCYITFDNTSDDGEISKIKTTVMLDGNERSLGLLSGGQFRRVQLAVDFALSDIVSQRSTNPINIRILDESFRDLSERSMERVINILQKMTGSTILIEHNSIIKNIVTNIYKVELKDGVSTHV